MSWGFLQETWPIEDGTELNSQHFEDLRLWLLLLDNLHTGYQLYNSGREYEAGDTCIMPSDGLLYQYNGASWIAVVPMTPSDTTTWEAFIDTIGYPGEKYSPSYDPGYGKVPAGWSVALDAVYWNYPGGTPDWYVMIDTQGLTRGQLKNNMPTDANGNLNNYWKHAVNPNKITSYDKNAERYIVQHTSGVIPNTSEDFFSIAYPAYRRAMQQTDSGKQEWPILYEDTERIMPHRKLNLEIKKEHITHNSTLGPNFTVEAFDVGVHVRSIVATKVVSGKNVGLAGYQYAIGVGSAEPDKNLPDVLEYYENEEAFFGSEPLESVTVDGETYVYHTKVHGEENDGTGIGSVINMGLTTDINGYEAYELIYYYNPAPEREDLSSPGDFYGLERYEGGMKVFCLFELKQIDESLDGFILLKCINASSSYNVCKTLGSEFSIIVRDFAI